MDEYLDDAKVFKALGEPKRVMIVDMLSCGELCACMILQKFKMSQSTLSHHMKFLCESGLVKSSEKGKWTYYSLNLDAINRIKHFFNDITLAKNDCDCREEFNSCEGSNENEQ